MRVVCSHCLREKGGAVAPALRGQRINVVRCERCAGWIHQDAAQSDGETCVEGTSGSGLRQNIRSDATQKAGSMSTQLFGSPGCKSLVNIPPVDGSTETRSLTHQGDSERHASERVEGSSRGDKRESQGASTPERWDDASLETPAARVITRRVQGRASERVEGSSHVDKRGSQGTPTPKRWADASCETHAARVITRPVRHPPSDHAESPTAAMMTNFERPTGAARSAERPVGLGRIIDVSRKSAGRLRGAKANCDVAPRPRVAGTTNEGDPEPGRKKSHHAHEKPRQVVVGYRSADLSPVYYVRGRASATKRRDTQRWNLALAAAFIGCAVVGLLLTPAGSRLATKSFALQTQTGFEDWESDIQQVLQAAANAASDCFEDSPRARQTRVTLFSNSLGGVKQVLLPAGFGTDAERQCVARNISRFCDKKLPAGQELTTMIDFSISVEQ